MTPEAQRIAIAEACGWTRSDESYPYKGGICKRIVWRNPKGEPQPLGDDALPNYIGDLNAMHEAEWGLMSEQHAKFRETLREIQSLTGGVYGDYERAYVSAPPEDRAEAFLRTLNLWKD